MKTGQGQRQFRQPHYTAKSVANLKVRRQCNAPRKPKPKISVKATSFSVALIVSVQLALVAYAKAQVVTYTLSGVTFSDGATAEGSFDFSSGTISNINITTTVGVNGDALPGFTYTNFYYSGADNLQFCVTPNPFGDPLSNPGPAFLVLFLTNGMSGLGSSGTIPLSGGAEEYGPSVGITNSRSFSGGELIGIEPPIWTSQPMNQVVSAGQGFTFTAQAVGFPLPTYQWQFSTDGLTFANLSGATGASYSLASSSLTNIGYYLVVASNSVSTKTSSAATLTFLNINININMLAAVYVIGPTGAQYQIFAAPALGTTNWTTLTNVTITSQPYVFTDFSTPTNRQQFYRTVPQ